MPLEDPVLLKKKNKKRLRDSYNITAALGISIEKPTSFRNPRWIIAAIIIISSWLDAYGHISLAMLYEENLFLSIESFCTMLQTMISTFKLTYVLFVQDRFYKIYRALETNELIDKVTFLADETPYNKELRAEAFKILEDCWRIAKRQFNFYMCACIVIISYYFFSSQFINAYNWYIGNTSHRIVYPFVAHFPFWAEKAHHWPYYGILTFIDSCADYSAGICAIGFDGMFVIIAMHCVALFRILKRMIVFTTSPQVPKHLRVEYLRQCIFHYNRTFQYCKDFNEIFLHISLVQFILSLAIFGMVIFQAFNGLSNNFLLFAKMVSYMTAAGYQVVIYCLNGQFVFNESETVPYAWYECEWYNESREFQQMVKMMILRTNRTFIMRASWFTTMSLPTLMAIIRTSVSYFLLLRNVTD